MRFKDRFSTSTRIVMVATPFMIAAVVSAALRDEPAPKPIVQTAMAQTETRSDEPAFMQMMRETGKTSPQLEALKIDARKSMGCGYLTLARYYEVKVRSRIEAAERIIGCEGLETSSTNFGNGTTRFIVYTNPTTGGAMQLVVQNNVVTGKSQDGLR